MHSDLHAVHKWAVIDTLEEAAFVFAEPCESNEIDWEDRELLRVELDLGTPPMCRLSLITSKRLSREIAGNMLGYELDELVDSESLARDALAETLNMVAGVVVSHLPHNGSRANIGLPRVAPVPKVAALGSAHRDDAIILNVNSNTWVVALTEVADPE